MPPAPLFEPANRIVTISERGKPAQKCRLLQQWTQPNGGEAYQVQALDSGELMTIVQFPATTVVGSGPGKMMAITIYHWTGNTPHPLAPVLRTTVQTTPIAPIPAAVAQASPPTMVAQQTTPLPASAAPVATARSNGLSLFGQLPLAMPAPQGTPMPPQGRVSDPQHPSGAMTSSGAVVSPAGSIHAFSNRDTAGDCCTTCKPSILERIKGIFHRNSCPTGYGPDACTPDNGPYPAVIARGEKSAPTPVAPILRAPRRMLTGPVQRSKPVDGADTSTSMEMPKADTQRPPPGVSEPGDPAPGSIGGSRPCISPFETGSMMERRGAARCAPWVQLRTNPILL
jgi:hypothetical protein